MSRPEDDSIPPKPEEGGPPSEPPLYPSKEELEHEDEEKTRLMEEALYWADREITDTAEWEPPEHDYENPTTGFEYDYVQHAPPEPKVLPGVGGAAPTQQAPTKGFRSKALVDVKAEAIPWLWPKRLAFGTLSILDGDPGCGKTSIVLDLMARLSTGRAMPFETTTMPPMNSLIVSAEDSLAHTLRPRTEAAGADLSRLFAVMEFVLLPSGVEKLKETIKETRARLVLIDPGLAMIDEKINPTQDAEVRKVVGPLAALAAHTESVIVFVRHLNKALHSKSMYRGGSSIGIAATARTCLLTGKLKDGFGLANYKSNLGPLAPTVKYELVDNGSGIVLVHWKDVSTQTADEVLDEGLPPGYRAGKPAEAEVKKTKKAEILEVRVGTLLGKTPDGLTVSDMRGVLGAGQKRIESSLEKLVEKGIIEPFERPAGKHGGRPTTAYRLSEEFKTSIPPQDEQPQEDFGNE